MALIDEEDSFEGYLEKHGNNPVSRMRGKKKMWCYLLGPNLYCHTENKSSSITSTIDLSQAQMIKVVPSDKTKTQFEITTFFKSYIFTAPSSEDCQTWIKKLQKAMTVDSRGSQSSTTRSENSVSSMSSVSSTSQSDSQKPIPENKSSSSIHLSDGYSEVNDFVVQLRPKSGASVAMGAESSHYQSITLEDEVFRKSSSEKNKLQQISETPEAVHHEYSQVIPKSERPSAKANLESTKLGANGIPGNETHVAVTKSEELSDRNNQRSIVNSRSENKNDYGISKSRQESFSDSDGESIDDIHSYIPETFPTIPKLENSVTSDDRSPIKELQKFLINNKLDRLSSCSLNQSSDPVQDLKTYLDSLNL